MAHAFDEEGRTSFLVLRCLFPPAACQTSKSSAAVANQPENKPADEESRTADLQKAVQNPVASLISVPLQNNSNFSIGPYDRT